jgi:streptogramin lyase
LTAIVLTELVGGRVLHLDDLDPATLAPIGGAALAGPSGPARDANGSVLVAEMDGHRVALASPGSAWIVFGVQGGGPGEFDLPVATAFLPGGRLVVLDAGNCRLVRMDDITGAGWTSYGRRGRPTSGDPARGAYADPRGLAVDTAGRIWVCDPGAGRVTRIDAFDGSGWREITLPAAAHPPLPYGICAYADGVAIVDVGNKRLLRLDAAGTTTATVDLSDGIWRSPCFVAGVGADLLVVADLAANELRLLEATGAGFAVTNTLRGSPPDELDPLFDSLGGVTT